MRIRILEVKYTEPPNDIEWELIKNALHCTDRRRMLVVGCFLPWVSWGALFVQRGLTPSWSGRPPFRTHCRRIGPAQHRQKQNRMKVRLSRHRGAGPPLSVSTVSSRFATSRRRRVRGRLAAAAMAPKGYGSPDGNHEHRPLVRHPGRTDTRRDRTVSTPSPRGEAPEKAAPPAGGAQTVPYPFGAPKTPTGRFCTVSRECTQGNRYPSHPKE
jgi:hypothetical protein